MKIPSVEKYDWGEWRSFPDPRRRELLIAPIGPGVYELRYKKAKKRILFGESKNVASRMSSLLNKRYGVGTRKNQKKRNSIFHHIKEIEYRALACKEKKEAQRIEKELKHEYIYINNN
jgi:hypothetical protein